MHRSNEITFGCILAFYGAGCSAITTWPDVNDKTQSGGASHRGGASSRGGNSASNAAGAAGIQDFGGAALGIGGLAHAGTSNSGTAGQSGNSTIASAGAAGLPTLGSSFAGSTAQAGNTAGGAAGTANVAGGVAGTGAVTLTITTPTMPTGKTGVPYATSITATGATQYSWSIGSGSLPGGITLQNVTSASVSIAGTPTEAGLFPVQLSVTDGTATQSVDVMLAVTHKVAFLSDRTTPGVQELYMVEVGGEKVGDPVRLSAARNSDPAVTTFKWAPDGSKVAYLDANGKLSVAFASAPGIGYSIASSVAEVGWFADANALAYSTTTASAYVVDVAGKAPWASQQVTLPAAIGSDSRTSIYRLIASPVGRMLGLAAKFGGTAAPPGFGIYWVRWPADSVPITLTLGSYSSSTLDISFSFDGSAVALWNGDTGLVVWPTLATDATSRSVVSPEIFGYYWAPNSTTILTQRRTDKEELMTWSYANSTVSLVPRKSPSSCTPHAGPWSPNGNHVLFRCDADIRAIANIESATVNSDLSILPVGFLVNAFTDVSDYGWSPDSGWIAVRADKDANGLYDLYLVRWSSLGSATKPYVTSAVPGVSTWQFTPNSRAVAFVGTLGTSTNPELYLSTLPTTGTPFTAAALTSATTAAVQNDINWLPGSRVILYRASDNGGPQLHAIHVSASGTSGTPTSISGVSGAGVPSYQVAPLPR